MSAIARYGSLVVPGQWRENVNSFTNYMSYGIKPIDLKNVGKPNIFGR